MYYRGGYVPAGGRALSFWLRILCRLLFQGTKGEEIAYFVSIISVLLSILFISVLGRSEGDWEGVYFFLLLSSSGRGIGLGPVGRGIVK